ncbi:MAG TPA: xanthine dehydrogenase family protein molybdopterin-binding subunit [Methylomirabilota bacterium]|jgi:CO/xanthine dehydrogenase Mo-binding subunit|nr:xanthine dehydrogenase family protein molybdopterin-binding subunit [Methylomirabilota bacterium]
MTTTIGASVRRVEDARLLTGRGRYVDDLRVDGCLHAAIVRSPHAHAAIRAVDARAALRVRGVVAVLTARDVPECAIGVPPLVPSPLLRPYRHPAIADAVARHAGEAVAVVVADDAYRAADGADAVRVTWEPRPAAASVEAALAPGAPRVFEEWPDNVAGVSKSAIGDTARGFAEADVIVDVALAFPRVAGVPIEPRGVLAHPATPDGLFTVWSSTQVPYGVRAAVAAALGLGESRVRVLAPDVGGGFGIKGHPYAEEVLIAAVARRLGRPVKWIETRREHFLTAAPDRDQRHRARIGVRRDGTITALETRFTRDHGAYPTLGDAIALNTINHLPGPYRVPNLAGECVNVVTHKTFMGAYRGAGRPEAAFVLDRLLDRAARRLGMDGADFRRRNLIAKGAMPYRTGLTYRDGVAITYDPADYVAAFDRALALLDYARWRDEARRRRGGPRPVGLGVSAYVEGTGLGPFEGADVRVDPGGRVFVALGVSSQGQAHETTLAQVCAGELGVPLERVSVLAGDTALIGFGNGTIASRVAANAGPAVARAAREVARRARVVAGEMLECAPEDVVLAGGRAHVAGAPDRGVALGTLATRAPRSRGLAAQGAPGLHACLFFHPETVTWAFGAHACAVEVDVETGAVRLLGYAAVHDCGRPINPMVVEGQLHGGIAQGLGTALREELVHDAEGQLLTGTLMDYGVPAAGDVPALVVEALDHPSVINELGIKGVGESGIISPSAAVAGAVEDALADRGVEIGRIPLLPHRVWDALRRP